MTGYAIEYKSGSRTFWTKSGSVNANTLTYTVTKLATETEYYFRVSALNAEGSSKPTETADAIRPMKKIGKLITQVENIFVFELDLKIIFKQNL